MLYPFLYDRYTAIMSWGISLYQSLQMQVIVYKHINKLPFHITGEKLYARHSDTTTTPPLHVAYSQQGYKARTDGAEMAVDARIQISV